jgi:uncharacterized protein (DUF1330 family)
MPGYVGTLLDIHDQERFREYLKGVGPSLAKHGGRIALRGPIVEVPEGKLDTREDTRLVMIEFDSLQAARDWYESDEYQELIELRQEPVASTTAFFIDGIDLQSVPAGR